MRALLSLFCFLFAANFVFAAEVGLAAAKEFAHGWRGRAVKGARTVQTGASAGKVHVVNFEGGGWAAIGADDEDAPVIAFSDDGEDLVEDDENPVWFLVKRDAQRRAKGREIVRKEHKGRRGKHKGWEYRRKVVDKVRDVRKELEVSEVKTAAGSLEDVRVAPLLKSTWNQKTANNYSNGPLCYNYYTPNNYYCGCVATAVAQVMRYHEWPKTTVPVTKKKCWVDGVAEDLYTRGEPYDWSIMTLNPNGNTTEDCRREIGLLCYDVGVAHQMQYSSKGSGTYSGLSQKVLVETFKYAFVRYIAYHNQYNPFNFSEFKTVIVTNCDAGYPVCLGIGKSNSNSGHAVVADGYGYHGDAFYVHINAGWGGTSNAWYCPPDEILVGYDVIDDVIYNIFPTKTGSIVSGRVLDHFGNPIANADVDFYTVVGGKTNVLGSVSTNAKGIYSWISDTDRDIVCYVRAGHLDEHDIRKVEASRKLTIRMAGTFEPSDVLDDGRSYLSIKPSGFRLGNSDAIDFTLDLRRTVPKILFR